MKKNKRNSFRLWKDVFPNIAYITFVKELKRQLEGCSTILDIGCGDLSPLRFISANMLVGVDGHKESLEKSERLKIHNAYSFLDVQSLSETRTLSDMFVRGQFDCCIALDLIEHLSKEDGYSLLRSMEVIAGKRVIVFTPNGFLPQNSQNGDLQEHISGWEIDEMAELGYRVIGMYGHKFLRGEYHNLRFHPKCIFGVISEFTHYVSLRNHPRNACAIMCVKEL